MGDLIHGFLVRTSLQYSRLTLKMQGRKRIMLINPKTQPIQPVAVYIFHCIPGLLTAASSTASVSVRSATDVEFVVSLVSLEKATASAA